MISITDLLQDAAQGNAQASHQLFARLYPEIKRVARARLADAGGVTGLQATALVHEGFLKLADGEGLRGATRGQFFAYVGSVLRSVVIDHLRARQAHKRGGDVVLVTMSHADESPDLFGQPADLLDLDRALTQMRGLDVALYELIEMSAFTGMSLEEIAELRGVSTRTVNRDLRKARALLAELLGEDLA